MNTASIIIENGQVMIRPTADKVWLTQHQIANLFGVFVSAVGSNIRSILKSEVLRENEVCRRQEKGNGSFIEVYNLEMITVLAFRLKSEKARQYRRWLTEQAFSPVILWKIPGIDIMLN
jgi:Virulence protein